MVRLRHGIVAVVLGLGLAFAPPAAAIEQPPGALKGVELAGNLPEAKFATAINFLVYGKPGKQGRDVMLATGRFGLKTYDLADPAAPVLLDEITSEDLRLPDDPPVSFDPPPAQSTFWQNEDMDVDDRRKLVFLSRDPRSYQGTTDSDESIAGVYIVDAADPADLKLTTFKQLPTGHTTSCVNDCDFLWTGGPAASNGQKAQLGWTNGRPIIVTDVRDPANPVSYPGRPVDLFRQDGVTAYSHDVDVDGAGVAWVSGAGGIRGFHTRGWRYDWTQKRWRTATAVDPVPYAGGGIGDDAVDEVDTPGGFMHNAFRPAGRTLRDGPKPTWGTPPGSVVLGTEEDFNDTLCDGEGQFVISSLRGSFRAQGWKSTPEAPFRLETVGTWSPKGKEATVGGLPFCSAHYFEVKDRLIAYAWYGQGTRFLDVSDARNPVQVGYYRPDGGNVWASYFHRGLVYTADHTRGIDILRPTANMAAARRAGEDLAAPEMSAAQQAFLRAEAVGLRADPQLGWLCPLPV